MGSNEHTSLLLLDLILLEPHPCQVRKLIRKHSTKEDLGNRSSIALVKAHLEKHQIWIVTKEANVGTNMRGYWF